MLRILQKILGIAPREPLVIFERRAILQERQRKNLEVCSDLEANPNLLETPLSELSTLKADKMSAFISRCALPENRSLNFLADMNVTGALEMNRWGIPFTVKDHLKVNDMVSTCGYSKSITPAYENAEVVDLLIKEGCVPFAHTNVPQGLLNIESGNNVWGTSLNPYNKGFVSGGSSGGEGAAVAVRCTPFGLASDAAGSSRIPAAFCGVIGYKPTGSVRLSRKGRLGAGGQERYGLKDLDASMGFITRSVDDLSWLCERTLGKSINYNPYVIGEWDAKKFGELQKKKLKFGYIVEDHEMKATPSVRNALMESVELLRKDGHEVVEFNFSDLYKFRDFTFKILNACGTIGAINKLLMGENETKQTWWIHERSSFGRIGSWLREITSSHPLEKALYRNYNVGNSFADVVKICEDKDLIKGEFLKAWSKSGIDVLITPVMPFTAPLKNSHPYLLNQLTFCGFPNVLEMPAGSVPVRLVRQDETVYDGEGFYESKIASSVKLSQGLPIGIQIVAPYMEDELCVAAMKQLERLLPKIPRPNLE